MEVPEKKSRVSTTPPARRDSAKALGSAAAVTGSAVVSEILGTISPSDGETANHDTTLANTPKKRVVKKK